MMTPDPSTPTRPPPLDPLQMILRTLEHANSTALGTDSRLRLALVACEQLSKLALYQQEQLGWLKTEIASLREDGRRP